MNGGKNGLMCNMSEAADDEWIQSAHVPSDEDQRQAGELLAFADGVAACAHDFEYIDDPHNPLQVRF
jgi:hypothetical protein